MRSPFYIFVFASVVIVLLQACVFVSIFFIIPDWQTRGQFGDLFGVVNSLFSGLAFAGLICTILLQREDLALQRTELELTRCELKRTAEAQEQSEIALRAQAEAAERSSRLAATNFLLDHYKRELSQMYKVAFSGNDPRLPRLQELQNREAVLLEELEKLFDEITHKNNINT